MLALGSPELLDLVGVAREARSLMFALNEIFSGA